METKKRVPEANMCQKKGLLHLVAGNKEKRFSDKMKDVT
jgi:hypothetical protein